MQYQDTPNKIPARQICAVPGVPVADAADIFDINIEANQHDINANLYDLISALSNKVDIKTDMAVVQKATSDTSVDADPDKVYMWPSAMTTLTVTLKTPEDTSVASLYTFLVLAANSDSANVSFISQGNLPIHIPSDYYIEPNVWNEVQILFAGNHFFVRSINYL